MEPREFLSSHPPFDQLGAEDLSRVERGLEIVYAARGETVLRRGDPENRYLWVVRKGAVRLEQDGRLLQVLEDGEPFGFPSLLTGGNPLADVVAEEDCLLYRIPKELFDRLMERREFADFFLLSLARRLRLAVSLEPMPLAGDLSAPATRLVTRPPVEVDPSTTVEAAARRMTECRVSSLLVAGDPPGIVTDRDLRSRVLARGLDGTVAIGEVTSRPLKSVPAGVTVFEALLAMLEQRVHHLPLVEDGRIIGVVTDTDLLRHQAKSPVSLLKRVEKLDAAEHFAGYAEELTGMVAMLYQGQLDAARIGRIVSTLNDAATARLLRLAEEELGPPPVAYAWIVFGSEGRREQALLTDQDNALVYAEASAEAKRYFSALAERVVGGLVGLSIPLCAGGFMATNWCLPLAEWERLFSRWVHTPEPEALLEAASFFDHRPVGGALSLASLDEIVLAAAGQRVFLAHMAKNAIDFRPPLGLFHRIRGGGEGIDLKKGGIMPIVGLARLYALEAGLPARGTLERLDAAVEGGGVSLEGAETLAEAFRFLLRLRLGRQLEAKRQGAEPDNLVQIERLSPLERHHLKDSFVAIQEMQEAVALRYGTHLLG